MAVLQLLAAGIGALGVRLRQPLIVAFIAVGILVGPSVLSWVSANDQIDLLAKLGISLLLSDRQSMSAPDQRRVQWSLSFRHVASDPTSPLFVQPYNRFESRISFSTLHLFVFKDKVLR